MIEQIYRSNIKYGKRHPRKMNMNYQMEIRIIWNPKFHPVLYIDIYICTSLTKYINIEDRSLGTLIEL
jgi:hypothetical protein